MPALLEVTHDQRRATEQAFALGRKFLGIHEQAAPWAAEQRADVEAGQLANDCVHVDDRPVFLPGIDDQGPYGQMIQGLDEDIFINIFHRLNETT